MSEKKAVDAAVFEAIRDLAKDRAGARIDAAIEMYVEKIVVEEIRKAVRKMKPLDRWKLSRMAEDEMRKRIKVEVERRIPRITVSVDEPTS